MCKHKWVHKTAQCALRKYKQDYQSNLGTGCIAREAHFLGKQFNMTLANWQHGKQITPLGRNSPSFDFDHMPLWYVPQKCPFPWSDPSTI